MSFSMRYCHFKGWSSLQKVYSSDLIVFYFKIKSLLSSLLKHPRINSV